MILQLGLFSHSKDGTVNKTFLPSKRLKLMSFFDFYAAESPSL
jgi:hypothetical protein